MMAATQSDKVLEYLTQVEEVAEDILADRQQIIDLDRRRNKTREAIRALQKDKTSEKTWVCFGNMFLKLPKGQVKSLLRKDFDQLDAEIGDLHSNLKPKVSKLNDMEEKEDIKGFGLKALSKSEVQSLKDVL